MRIHILLMRKVIYYESLANLTTYSELKLLQNFRLIYITVTLKQIKEFQEIIQYLFQLRYM